MTTARIVAAIALILGIVGLASPASASPQYIYNGSDVGWSSNGYSACSGCTQHHRAANIEDRECDGNKVQLVYTLWNSSTRHHLWDNDGCGGDYYTQNWDSWGNAGNLDQMKICENNGTTGAEISCSHWEDVLDEVAS